MPNWKKIIVSGSDASLSSAYIEGNLTASAAFLTSASIGHLETIYETASVIYSSGSTKFGDTSDDTHERTGSLSVSGSITGSSLATNQFIYHTGDEDTKINFSDNRIRFNAGGINLFGMHKKSDAPHQVTVNNGGNNVDFVINDNNSDVYFRADASLSKVSGSFIGDGSGLTSIATAITASHTTGTASFANSAITASHTAGTASFSNISTLSRGGSGSFSGSFQGDGSGLTGVSVTADPGYSNDITLTSDFTTNVNTYNSLYGPLTIGAGTTVTVSAGSFLKVEDF